MKSAVALFPFLAEYSARYGNTDAHAKSEVYVAFGNDLAAQEVRKRTSILVG